jgi:hypothetical protein
MTNGAIEQQKEGERVELSELHAATSDFRCSEPDSRVPRRCDAREGLAEKHDHHPGSGVLGAQGTGRST